MGESLEQDGLFGSFDKYAKDLQDLREEVRSTMERQEEKLLLENQSSVRDVLDQVRDMIDQVQERDVTGMRLPDESGVSEKEMRDISLDTLDQMRDMLDQERNFTANTLRNVQSEQLRVDETFSQLLASETAAREKCEQMLEMRLAICERRVLSALDGNANSNGNFSGSGYASGYRPPLPRGPSSPDISTARHAVTREATLLIASEATQSRVRESSPGLPRSNSAIIVSPQPGGTIVTSPPLARSNQGSISTSPARPQPSLAVLTVAPVQPGLAVSSSTARATQVALSPSRSCRSTITGISSPQGAYTGLPNYTPQSSQRSAPSGVQSLRASPAS